MVRPERFELPTLWFEARCSIQLSYGRIWCQFSKQLPSAGDCEHHIIMSKPGSNHEVEVKIAIGGANQAKAMLRRAGFRVSKRRRFEANAVFDTPARKLRRARQLLRVRQVGNDVILTYKGPGNRGKHKSREEIETHLHDAKAIHSIFTKLGFEISFLYEKYRTELRQSNGEGVVTVDETPIGNFLELEGPPDWIDRTAASLGYPETSYITASYGGLYLEWCKQLGKKPSHMTFHRRHLSTKV